MEYDYVQMGTNKLVSSLPDIYTFVLVAEAGSFTKAATQLNVTSSAVSKQIARIEDALSVKLIERTTRNLRLTEPGEKIYSHCKNVISATRDMFDAAEGFSATPSGLVRVSVPKAFGRQVIGPLIPQFLSRYPEIDVHLMVTDRAIDPIFDNVDLIISITNQPDEGLATRKIKKIPQVLCASPDYLKKRGAPSHPKELVDHDCLYLGENKSDCLWKFKNASGECTVKVSGRYIINHSELRMDGVLNHLGIGCFPEFAASQLLNDGKIVKVLEDWEFVGLYQGYACIQYLSSRYVAPKNRAFIDFIIEKIGANWGPYSRAL